MSVKMSDESSRVLAQHAKRPAEILRAIRATLKQWLDETATHLESKYLSGGSWREPRRGKTPLASRTGSLMRSMQTRVDQPTSGTIGSANNKYAKVLLDGKSWTMTPKNANHLWIPLPDNMTGNGVMRMSPREAMSIRTSSGKRALQIFTSKKGNLVAFMPGNLVEDKVGKQMGLVSGSGITAVSAGRHKRGELKGKEKGKLLFVLKKSVTVEGTDALGKAIQDKQPRLLELLSTAVMNIDAGGEN